MRRPVRFNLVSKDFESILNGKPLICSKPKNDKWTDVEIGDEIYITKGYPNLFTNIGMPKEKRRIIVGHIVKKAENEHGIDFTIQVI